MRIKVIIVLLILLGTAMSVRAQDTLPLGEPVTGEITDEVTAVEYIYEGTAGETITLFMSANPDPATGNRLDSYLTLTAPDGTLLFNDDGGSNLNSYIGPYTLPLDGTYIITATRFGEATGASQGAFQLIIEAADPTPLVLGETVTLDVTTTPTVLSYTPAEDEFLRLTGSVEGTVPPTATYNVEVRQDVGQTFSSGFSFPDGTMNIDSLQFLGGQTYYFYVTQQLQQLAAELPPLRVELTLDTVPVTTLAVGESTTIEVSDSASILTFSPGEFGIFRLTATSDTPDRFYVAEVLNSVGFVNSSSSLPNGDLFIDPLILEPNEVYQVRVFTQKNPSLEDESEPIAVTLQLDTVQVKSIAFGEQVTGSLNDENPVSYFRFAGDTTFTYSINGSRVSGDIAVGVDLFSIAEQRGIQGTSSFFNGDDGIVLNNVPVPSDGDYLMVVRRVNEAGLGVRGTSTEFELTLSAEPIPVLASGVANEGVQDINIFETLYLYEGQEGQTIRITLESLDLVYAPNLEVQTPENDLGFFFLVNTSSTRYGTFIYETVLPLDGTYLFRVRNGGLGPAPEVRFSLMVEEIE